MSLAVLAQENIEIIVGLFAKTGVRSLFGGGRQETGLQKESEKHFKVH
jgi:hypothetical protein